MTDRDITIRAVASGKSPTETTVREVMSPGVKYVFEDESTQEAARKMADLQVRRLPVLNRAIAAGRHCLARRSGGKGS